MARETAREPEPIRPDLSELEQREVEERRAIGAHVVFETIRQEGEDELRRPMSALAWSGLAAGLSMGFSLVAEGVLRSALPDEPWRPLVAKLGYTVGFLIVVLGRQQLFTENTLTAILPLLSQRTPLMLARVARLWITVLVANIVGSLAFAWVVGGTDVFQPAVRAAFAAIGKESLAGDPWTMVLRGVFAGWLIALMVWLLPGAETARVAIIGILAYLVGVAGLAHVVVGSVEVFYLVTTGAASWGDYFVRFAAPTLLGNVVGGVALVSLINYAQVVSGASNRAR